METRSVSPPSVSKGADTSSELPAGTKEGSPNVPVSGSVPLSEDSLQEIPEKKQKAAKTRSRAKTPKKAASQRHRKSRVHHETQPDLPSSSSSSSTSAELPQVPSPPSRPAEPDVVIALECSEDTESVVSRIATEGVLTGCDPSATKVVSQSDLSPTAIALWKDILKKEVLLHELSKKAEAVMAVLNDQLEICRSLGVDVLSVDREIADLVEFKAINKK